MTTRKDFGLHAPSLSGKSLTPTVTTKRTSLGEPISRGGRYDKIDSMLKASERLDARIDAFQNRRIT